MVKLNEKTIYFYLINQDGESSLYIAVHRL